MKPKNSDLDLWDWAAETLSVPPATLCTILMTHARVLDSRVERLRTPMRPDIPRRRAFQYILDEAGEAVPCTDGAAWDRCMGGDRSVAVEHVGDRRVSTVFLGIDHNFGGVPMLFETMVFLGDHGDTDDRYMRRYSTRQEALDGHELVVEELKREQGGEADDG